MIDMYLHLDFTHNEKFILNLQHFALNIIHISKKKIFQFPLAFVKFTSIIVWRLCRRGAYWVEQSWYVEQVVYLGPTGDICVSFI